MSEITPTLGSAFYPDNKTQFTQQYFEPAKKSGGLAHISNEVAFEIAAKNWQQQQGHPLPFGMRAWLRWRNGR